MEMMYCVEHAIPHSRFLSWPADDQDKVIAYLIREGERCRTCGTFPDLWIDPETKRTVEPPPYHLHTLRCQGCVTIAKEEDMAMNEKGIFMRFERAK